MPSLSLCDVCEWHHLYDTNGHLLTESDPATIKVSNVPPTQSIAPNNRSFDELSEKMNLGAYEDEDIVCEGAHMDKATLVANSPISRASAITAPVFLAHGVQDPRVPIQYANAMQSALKSAGHTPEFVSYPWEAHSLLDPTNEQDFYARLLSFLANNLGSSPVNANDGQTGGAKVGADN